jgi:PGF-pre-PGF domain-containing protein
VTFNFPQKVTPVVSVSFDSKKTTGKTTTIVEMLKAKSILVSGAPADEVYNYVNMWVGNSGFATPNNIKNAVVNFKVEKSWIQDKKIDKSTITLNWYNDSKWDSLPTSLSSEDDNYLYYAAQTPGFSNFAITGKITASLQPSVEKSQTADINETQTGNNNGNTTANNEQTQSQTTSNKGSIKSPGLEAFFGMIGMLAVYLYKKK